MKTTLTERVKANEKIMKRIQKVIDGTREMTGTYKIVTFAMIQDLTSYDEFDNIIAEYKEQDILFNQIVNEIIGVI